MKINVVTESNSDWILSKISEQWSKYLPNCSISRMTPDQFADINLYVHWELYQSPTNADVGFFTHRGDPERNARWDLKSEQMDFCICMSSKSLEHLPQHKSKVIKPGVHPQFSSSKKKIVFGIVGKEWGAKRKGFEKVEELRFIPNVEFKITNGEIPFNELPDFYSKIDYLLILSKNEGGPVPVLEAMSLGKPVIAPNVGWCWDYPVIKYNNIEELKNIISSLSSYTNTDKPWVDSSHELTKIFTLVLERKMDFKKI